MSEEIVANFSIEEQPETTATFSIQENNIEAGFSINPVIADKYFVFEQAESSDEWLVKHNLNKKASVTIVDEYDRVVEGDIQYIDNNTIKICFKCLFKGKVYLN